LGHPNFFHVQVRFKDWNESEKAANAQIKTFKRPSKFLEGCHSRTLWKITRNPATQLSEERYKDSEFLLSIPYLISGTIY